VSTLRRRLSRANRTKFVVRRPKATAVIDQDPCRGPAAARALVEKPEIASNSPFVVALSCDLHLHTLYPYGVESFGAYARGKPASDGLGSTRRPWRLLGVCALAPRERWSPVAASNQAIAARVVSSMSSTSASLLGSQGIFRSCRVRWYCPLAPQQTGSAGPTGSLVFPCVKPMSAGR
jgi:hypothetical protein